MLYYLSELHMGPNQHKFKENPLVGFMRQPKIYVRLPSNGQFWPTGSLEPTETGEYPVYSMTAKDELMLKIPDALLNGQAVVDVIQHCMPNIKNAWSIPNIDLDAILIAIRIATYGETMKVPVKISDQEFEYDLDLRMLLDDLMSKVTWDEVLQITPELVVYVKPLDYRQMSASAGKTFESQKIISMVNDTSLSESDKARMFKEAIDKLNAITVDLVTTSIFKIDSSSGSTEEIRFIREFMDNVDKDIFDQIKSHIESLREHNVLKPLVINPTHEMLAQGIANAPIEIPLVFDPSTFFG